MTQTNLVTVSVEQLQQIYDFLKPIAGKNKNDCSMPVESCPVGDVQIDCCLSANDLNGVSLDTKTAPLKINGIWYGDFNDLRTIYMKAIGLDRQDGHFDGTIQTTENTFRVLLSTPVSLETNQSLSQYSQSVFRLTTTGIPTSSVGNTWIVESEILPNGLFRNWCLSIASDADGDNSLETSRTIDVMVGDQKKTISLTFQGIDRMTNVGVLYFDSEKQMAPIPTSEGSVQLGEVVTAYGDQGDGLSESKGEINNLEKYSSDVVADVQFSAVTTGDNTGSPVFSAQGDIVGMCRYPSEDKISLFIPIGDVLKSYRQIKTSGKVQHGYAGLLGITAHMVSNELMALGIEGYQYGLFVRDVPSSNPFYKEMRTGDVIVKYDGQVIPDYNMVNRIAAYYSDRAGQSTTLTLIRDGKEIDLTMPVATIARPSYPTYKTDFGFILEEVDQDFMFYTWNIPFSAGTYLVIKQWNSDSESYDVSGVLLSVNEQSVDTIEAFKQTVEKLTDKKLCFVIETYSTKNADYRGRIIMSEANPMAQ